MARNFDCPSCGHSLEGRQVGTRCPQCTWLIAPSAGATRPREWFVMGIRLLGMWYLAAAFQYGVAAISAWRALPADRADSTIESYGIAGAGSLLVGVYCLLGAPQLVGIAYGKRSPRAADASGSEPPASSS